MAIITNKDIKVMVDVEELLHKKIETEEEGNLWTDYWNIVEKFIQHKKYASIKSNEYNKKNKDYHRITNNIYNNRKIGNVEKVAYWENELKKLRESGINETIK